MLGHICLAVPSLTTFYLGLVLIATGTGLLKPNVSVLVGKLYAPDDVRRDAGYSIYYMGINTGAFIAPLITGWLAQSEGFKRDARLGGHRAGDLLALGLRRGGGGHVLRPGAVHAWREAPLARRARARSGRAIPWPRPRWTARSGWWVSSRLGVRRGRPSCWWPAGSWRSIRKRSRRQLQVGADGASRWGSSPGCFSSGEWTREERKRLVVIAVLFVAAVVFWMAYEQAGSTLNLFAERSTNNAVLGHSFPASLVPVAAAALHHPVRAGLRGDLAPAGQPEPVQSRPSSPSRLVLLGSASRDDRRGDRPRRAARG